MKDRRFWLAVVSALIATQHHPGEAAVAAGTDTDRANPVRGHATVVEEEAVVALFDDCRYEEVIETASAAWPRLDAMPERVLYCVSESSIRAGRVQAAKKGFELLIARNSQKQSYRAGLAYTLLYGGELERGLSLYHQVLAENRGLLAGAAEDAVALLSQGNIGGGKALFKMVMDFSPDQQYYRQLYQKSLRLYRIADDSAVSPGTDSPAPGTQQTSVMTKDERESLHTQAVAMAQNGQFEQYTGITMPFPVIKSVSTAYFELKEYDKAMDVLQPAVLRGERDALLWAGEMYLRRGDSRNAQLYYEWLLSGNPNDYEVYLSRGMLSMEIKDYRQAVWDLERARRLLPDSPDRAARLLNVEHKLATAYMQLGQDQKAASLLGSYTKTIPIEDSLASDYVTALVNSAQYELAVREGERLWPAYKGPLPGLRSLAESYIRLGEQDKAAAVYRQLAKQQPGDDISLRTPAFQAMLNGRTMEGLGLYDKYISQAAVHADEVAGDAETFINTDQYVAGKTLFELLLKKYPKPIYRQQYAEVLAKKKLNRAAYKQYQALADQAEGELAGLSGMARTALALGDYPNSRKALDAITGKYGRSKAVAALALDSNDKNVDNGTKNDMVQDNFSRMEPKVLSTAKPQEPSLLAVNNQSLAADDPEKSSRMATTVNGKEEFAYEMAQIATTFLAAPITNPETFKIDFAYAISTITAKVMPLLPSEQRNEFSYEMAQITSAVINEQNLDIKKAKAEFAQLTTKIINHVDSVISGEKPAVLQKNDSTEPKVHDAAQLDMDTYTGLIDDLMEVGHSSSKFINNKINIDGEIRYHYAANSGAARLNKDVTGLRLYLDAYSRISKDWHAYAMLEGQKNITNYNNKLELSRLYVAGKVGASTVKAGSFGYLMAEGNIYDSRFDGIRVDFGGPVKYTLSYGETKDTKATFIIAARYNDFDYNLESGFYHYQPDDGTYKQNIIWNISGNYNFSNFSLGAMYLRSSLQDSNGDNNGYVLSFNYGDQRDSRPRTYNLFAKYYNQARGTYIDHGMNGQGSSMEGMKGYGVGVNYTLAQNLVLGVEYYDLTDKVSGEKGKTLWGQVTHYF
ncbi:tetratricopeptide repeat protein [Sporomusa acidovorans]|uniref:Tetratricopeptide repeat protein n=1 Tax=Sporomusa acidovorans (strain ATCC 49682 / DSM 3132 / Mol) TaxID=1123286 RepID=A0ABZ3JB66_SPOA4|nr:tetratricopeptide repeat protein [Sporomusa acidovorans]OZC13294.1 tetratricopeptide repeat protein [Sporomusa acidovorans DSM 3132]SDD97841.1 Tetratricopeptide repeat-containing protein [Sporomusa acidovorans]